MDVAEKVKQITPGKKYGILDLRVKLQDDISCNVEVQLANRYNIEKRILFYWAKIFSSSLSENEDYIKLKRTISIAILDFELDNLKDLDKCISNWKIIETKSGSKLLTDALDIYIIELPKVRKAYKTNKKQLEDSLIQWMLFLDNPNTKEVHKIMEKNSDIEDAVKELKAAGNDNELRLLAELRIKAIRDEHAIRDYGIEKGRKEGYKHGKKDGVEQGILQTSKKIAKKMKAENLNIKLISNITGLTIPEIDKL